MTEFLQYLVGGLATGSVYGLIALGFVLVFKSTDVFNFAQGDLLMTGAYITVTALVTFNLPLGPAMIFALLAAAVIGLLIQQLIIRKMLGQPLLTVVMVTIALSLVIRGLIVIIYGPEDRTLESTLPNDTLTILGVKVSQLDLTIMAVAGGLRGAVRALLPAHRDRPADARHGREPGGVGAVGRQRRPGVLARVRARDRAGGDRRHPARQPPARLADARRGRPAGLPGRGHRRADEHPRRGRRRARSSASIEKMATGYGDAAAASVFVYGALLLMLLVPPVRAVRRARDPEGAEPWPRSRRATARRCASCAAEPSWAGSRC